MVRRAVAAQEAYVRARDAAAFTGNRAAVPDATPFIIPAGLPPEAAHGPHPEGGGRRCTKERLQLVLNYRGEVLAALDYTERTSCTIEVPRPMSIGVRQRFMVQSKVAGRE